MMNTNIDFERIEKLLNEQWNDYLTYKEQTDLEQYKGMTKLLKEIGLDYHRDLNGKHTIR